MAARLTVPGPRILVIALGRRIAALDEALSPSYQEEQVATKTKDVRTIITLACTECKERNYSTEKNRRNDPDRLEFNKFCKRCRKHTLHRETR